MNYRHDLPRKRIAQPTFTWIDELHPPYKTCVPDVLKHFLKQKNWTQQELAEKAGYSLRLISKAMSGNSISRNTIIDIAEALSSAEQTLHLEDLIVDPVVFARKYIDAFYIHQSEAIKVIEHFLCEETVFYVQGDPSDIPFAGEFRGIDGVDRMIRSFFTVLEVPENYDHSERYQYLADGNQVVVWGESWIQPLGIPLDEPVVISLRMTFQKGKLIRFEDRYDVKSANESMAKLRRARGEEA